MRGNGTSCTEAGSVTEAFPPNDAIQSQYSTYGTTSPIPINKLGFASKRNVGPYYNLKRNNSAVKKYCVAATGS